MRCAHVALGTLLAALCVLLSASQCAAEKPQGSLPNLKFDFKRTGGSKASLGVSRLERLRNRSGMDHKTADELAKLIDDDDDLVRQRQIREGL